MSRGIWARHQLFLISMQLAPPPKLRSWDLYWTALEFSLKYSSPAAQEALDELLESYRIGLAAMESVLGLAAV